MQIKEDAVKNEKFQEDALNEQLYIDVMQYKANLDKLMQIIRDYFSGNFHLYMKFMII